MKVEFYGYELEHSEDCFTPTTITQETAIRVPVEGKKVLDLGCGIGPLAVYFAKNGAAEVTATDLHTPHVEYTKLNAENNNVNVEVIQGDLFENINSKYDIIAIDVSGIDRNVAEITGWFPGNVPTADSTGADVIVRALQQAPEYLNEGGEIYCCTASFSDLDKIMNQMGGEQELVFEREIPFSRRLVANIDNLRPESYTEKEGSFFWKFALYKL
jgi:SAM-dependent methyltransferase